MQNNIFEISKEELIKKQVFAIDKPLNWTSNDIVRHIKGFYHFDKVGHGGTLDPLATGVLIIGVNEGTKLLHQSLNETKSYEFDVKLGIETKSYDMGTDIVKTENVLNNISLDLIEEKIKSFLPEYNQIPPVFSAKRVNGVKAYQLALKDSENIEIKPSLVKIYDYKLLNYDEINHVISIYIKVSKGFYIRSFAHDLALKLNSIGTVTKLNRIQSGDFNLDDCYKFIKLKNKK